MQSIDLMLDAFDRVRGVVHATLDGIAPADLLVRVDAEANPIGWLVWHLTRIEDDHVAGTVGSEQVWTAQAFVDRFGLPYDVAAHGYGQSAADVDAFHVDSASLLIEYFDAVHEATVRHVSALTEADFDRIVDPDWDPPVTLAVRLISVISDALQHAGQAAYVRGLVERRADINP